jgi:hypothetical protein
MSVPHVLIEPSQKLQDFTASCFVAGRDQQCLLHPAALSKLAFFVLEIDRKKYEDRRRVKGDNKALPASHSRWVLGVENEVRVYVPIQKWCGRTASNPVCWPLQLYPACVGKNIAVSYLCPHAQNQSCIAEVGRR